MGVATGLTAARMQEIINQQILRGAVNLDGDLVLTRADDTEFVAGNVRGPRGADAVIPDELTPQRIRVQSTADASLSSEEHPFQIGDTAGLNIVMDNNEIMARNNGATSDLYVQTDGGNVYVGNAQSDITVRGRLRLPANHKVFWTGASFFSETASIALSEPVTTQPNGICLQWSRYSGGAVQNDTYGYTWIPKFHVLTNPGAGVQCILQNGFSNPLYKYVYVNDSSIVGHANNDDSPGNQMVLRAVFGW